MNGTSVAEYAYNPIVGGGLNATVLHYMDNDQILREGERVLESELAGIAASRAGTALWEVDRASRTVFEKAGMPDCYTYCIGHGLGLDVHDALPK